MTRKKLLIISPYFPPSNAADMQRVRMSLPYFIDFGWDVTVATVNSAHSDMSKDELLLESIPKNIRIVNIAAFSKKWTGKVGVGSLALRSMFHYKKTINQLLKSEQFDLIYFSTTQFPLLILGAHWKRKFGIPYIIDMQDPWHSEYYQSKPKNERPKKHWFSYRLNKLLEPKAMQQADGLISVSQGYIDTLVERYPKLQNVPQRVITFSAFEPDLAVMEKHFKTFLMPYQRLKNHIHFVYVGRGGHDLKDAARILFKAFLEGLAKAPELFSRVRFHFLGTSYAPAGQGELTISPIAADLGLSEFVEEKTDRLPYYQALYALSRADHLLILGSDDKQYTASKIFPYLLLKKSILALFNSKSSAAQILKDCQAGLVVPIEGDNYRSQLLVYDYLNDLLKQKTFTHFNYEGFKHYLAPEMCKRQCELFEQVLALKNHD